MMDIKVGQVLEFIVPVTIEGRAIARGTRVRVGHVMSQVQEPKLTLVLLGEGAPETLVVNRHDVTLNCRIVSES
jgi:hypothetical protein